MKKSMNTLTKATLLNKTLVSIMAVFAMLVNFSCSEEIINEAPQPVTPDEESGMIANAPSKEVVGDVAGSRSRLELISGNMVFKWDSGDKLTVFALDNDNASQTYRLLDGEGSNKAHFISEDFKLTNAKRYFTVSKVEGSPLTAPKTKLPDQNNITFDFSGQVQIGNGGTTHLGNYNYLVSSSVASSSDDIHFDFTHLTSTLRIYVMPEDDNNAAEFNATKFHTLKIYDSENSFRQPKRSFAFSAGYNKEKKTYSPKWPEQIIDNDELFTLKMQVADNDETGVTPSTSRADGSSSAKPRLVAYMEVPEHDFTGKTIGFIIEGKYNDEPVTYYGSYDGFNLPKGILKQINLKPAKSTNYEVALKINHMWQLGNTAGTRATGDPGNEDKFGVPPYIYYIYCVNDTVRNVTPIEGTNLENLETAQAVNMIQVDGMTGEKNNTPDSKDSWTPNTEKTISTYGKKLNFPVPEAERTKPKHLYVIASRTALPASTFTGITGKNFNETTNVTTESTIRNLVYSIDGVETTNISIDAPGELTNANKASQLFMRDLYSTPWDEKNFSGDLKNPVQDVFLYHVAAKVDLNWNSANPLTPTTDKVSVNNVNSTGLKLFTPTAAGGSGANYTVQNSITEGTMVNGRQVFYLPQFNSYNVSIGAHSYNTSGSNPVTFSPATTNGYTSWLRWLKNIKP